MKRTIFTLSSARSGTVYLRHLFRNNVPGCVTRHEPFFDWGNPTLFGRAIDDARAGRRDRICALLEKKRRYIERLPGDWYLESSHAFLKSAYMAAYEVFPDLRLVHLVRDPLKVARSEAYRQEWRRRVRAPFHFYTGDDGERHFVWSLTGNEPIFREMGGGPLSLFQWYVVQWVEIENRGMQFLERHQLHDRCFTLETNELNDRVRVREMFDFLQVPTFGPELNMAGRKNRSLGYSRTQSGDDEEEFEAVLERIPGKYLAIFERQPYCRYRWNERLCPRAHEVNAGSVS